MKTSLKKEALGLMNHRQKEIVLTQWQKHQHRDINVDYDVSGEGDMLKGLIIKKGVWHPLLASGRYHGRFLFYNTSLFYNRTVIEIGCGCGLLGMIMALYGAKKVIMSDIAPESVNNTSENVKKFHIKNARVIHSDLFQKINLKADVILWNIPFFPGYPPKGDTISASMIMPPELFEKFLLESKKHLTSHGAIIVPSYSLGGKFTDPSIVGKKIGYKVERVWIHNCTNGIQKGLLYIDKLTIN